MCTYAHSLRCYLRKPCSMDLNSPFHYICDDNVITHHYSLEGTCTLYIVWQFSNLKCTNQHTHVHTSLWM